MRARQTIAAWVGAGAWVALLGSVAPGCSSEGRKFREQSGGSTGHGGDGQSAGESTASGADGGASGGVPAIGDGGKPGGDSCDGVTCASEAACVSTPAPHCVCPDGYADALGDGTSCEDIDECATNNGGCDAKVVCLNTPGSFSCDACPDGYAEGAQGECADIDECATDNGGCDPMVMCTNTDGSRACGDCPDLSCGGSCCPAAPANAVAECSGTTCAVACKTNYHACSGAPSTCYANSDTQHCGDSCEVCSQPNATASCTNNACSYSCGAGLGLGCLYPDGRPVCSRWDFESNTVEGFAINTSTTTASDGRFFTSTKHASSGSRSLAIGFSSDNSNGIVEVTIPLCPGGQGIDLTKRTLSLVVYPETAAGTTPYSSPALNGNFVAVKGKSGTNYGGCDSTTPAADQAYPWTCAASGWPTDVNQITLVFRVFTKWSGTFYIDDVKLQ